jgi:RNA polymerase sigma factor (sigma-70 family)
MSTDNQAIEVSLRDPERFAVLYDRHAVVVYRYLTRRLGRQAAEDVLAETFLAAFDTRRAYDLTHPDARPWLLGIATNLTNRHLRTEYRHTGAHTRVPPPPPDEAETVVEELDHATATSTVMRALAQLPGQDRDCLLLYAWGQLSYEQVAAALQVPVGTVRSRLHRARRTLRPLLSATATSTHSLLRTPAMDEIELVRRAGAENTHNPAPEALARARQILLAHARTTPATPLAPATVDGADPEIKTATDGQGNVTALAGGRRRWRRWVWVPAAAAALSGVLVIGQLAGTPDPAATAAATEVLNEAVASSIGAKDLCSRPDSICRLTPPARTSPLSGTKKEASMSWLHIVPASTSRPTPPAPGSGTATARNLR